MDKPVLFQPPTYVSRGWDNRSMKRALLSCALILGLSVPISNPAHAIFGLSTCEKVKKKVLSLESEINSQSAYWYSKQSSNADLKLVPKLQAYDAANLIKELWKLQYNNPKCFTRTQNVEINSRKNLTTKDFVSWFIQTIRKNTKKCQSVEQLFETTPDCVQKKELRIYGVHSLPSIYDF